MSVEHLAICLHHSRSKGTAKLVLLGIANHCGDGGAWPSVDTLAKYANVAPRNVQKAVRALVTLGELVVHDPTAHRRTNLYSLTLTCPPSCDRSPNHRDINKLSAPQTELWITNPDGSVTPDAIVTPPPDGIVRGPLTPPSPEPSSKPSTEPGVSGPALTTDRARASRAAPCEACGQGPEHPWHGPDDHAYKPVQHHG